MTSNLISTSLIKQQSLSDSINDQGGSTNILLNTITQAVAEAGAKEIGYQYHGTADANGNVIHNISQSEQLTLHGVLGAGISAATQTISGNDNKESLLSSALSGAAAGVIGEIVADAAYQEGRTTKTEVLNQNGEVIGFTTQPLGFSRETSIQL